MESISLEELEKELLEAKQNLFRLREEKIATVKSRKLWFFQPSPKQLEFFANADKKRRGGFCGNRFGKSTLGVVEDICWLIGYRPFFKEGDPRRTAGIPVHGVKGLVIAEDLDKVKEIFTNNESGEGQGKFIEFLPDGWYTTRKNEKGIIVQINVKSEVNGVLRESVVMFDTVRSYKANPAGFESGDWDFIHVDEPVVKDLWTAASRGLIDRDGSSWWLLTPIKEPWMYNDMVDNAKKSPDTYWFFEADMDDNPTLTESAKLIYLDSLPEDEREARKSGKPLAHVRLVLGDYKDEYHKFDGNLPGWSGSKPPAINYTCYAIDNHPATPHAVLFLSISPGENGDIDIYDELFVKCRMNTLAETVLAKLEGVRLGYGLCDPSAWNTDQGSGVCHAETLLEMGLDVVPGSKRKEAAILLTQQLFHQRKRRVRVHARCVNLIKEIKHNYFGDNGKPVDKDDHLIECLRRLVIHDGLKYYSPSFVGAGQSFTTESGLMSGSSTLDNSNLSLTNF
jgi:hypothetical protein